MPTPDGPAVVARWPASSVVRATVVLGHGAGRGPDTEDLLALAEELPGRGADVVLVTAPWVLAGRRVASPPARLDLAWTAVLADLRAAGWLRGRLVCGGRSAGARVAARTGAGVGADALLLLAFPLHPPGRPAASRVGELLAAGRPAVVLQGDRDPFGSPAEVRAAVAAAGGAGVGPVDGSGAGRSSNRARIDVVAMPGADHGLRHRASAPFTAAEWRVLLCGAALRAVDLARG